MHHLTYKKKSYAVPSAWGECNFQQAAAAALLHVKDAAPERIELLYAMLGKSARRLVRNLETEQIVVLTQWAIDKIPDSMPDSFQHRGKVYFLPAADLSDVVMIEYMEADAAFISYQRAKTDEALLLFIAHLARPSKSEVEMRIPKWDGIRREEYNSALAPRRALELSGIPSGVAALVLIRWLRGIAALADSFPKQFKQDAAASEGGGAGMLEIVYHVAEHGPYRDLDHVLFTSIFTVLQGLEFKRQNAKRQ